MLLNEREIYLGVDSASPKNKSLSAISVIEKRGYTFHLIASAVAYRASDAFKKTIPTIESLGITKDCINDILKEIDAPGERVYSLTGKLHLKKPRCFIECNIPGCDMKKEHCGINAYPAMTRCTTCSLYFGVLEKIEDMERIGRY